MNAKTAHSQLIGGIVFGLGMALLEETHVDGETGRIVNANVADSQLPVNADVPSLEAILVEEADPYVNALGIKGVGEIGITGTSGAIANAVWHATGVRIRRFPITIEQLVAPQFAGVRD